MPTSGRFSPLVPRVLGGLAVCSLLFGVACGTAATSTPQPTAAPVATATTTAAATATKAPVPTSTAVPTRAPAVSTPVAERLKVAVTPPAAQVTVGWMASNSSIGPASPMYEALIQVNNLTGAFDPALATEWELSKDARSFRLKLRQGVTFHNGKEFTARDVVFTWERATDPKTQITNGPAMLQLTKSKDDFRVETALCQICLIVQVEQQNALRRRLMPKARS